MSDKWPGTWDVAWRSTRNSSASSSHSLPAIWGTNNIVLFKLNPAVQLDCRDLKVWNLADPSCQAPTQSTFSVDLSISNPISVLLPVIKPELLQAALKKKHRRRQRGSRGSNSKPGILICVFVLKFELYFIPKIRSNSRDRHGLSNRIILEWTSSFQLQMSVNQNLIILDRPSKGQRIVWVSVPP